MRHRKRAMLSFLGLAGLMLITAGVLVALRWDTVSAALATQAERTQVNFFRWGELGSIAHVMKPHFGTETEPRMSYDTDTGERVLTIAFQDLEVPTGETEEERAREVALFALESTARDDDIDTIQVQLRTGADVHSFARRDLQETPTRP